MHEKGVDRRQKMEGEVIGGGVSEYSVCDCSFDHVFCALESIVFEEKLLTIDLYGLWLFRLRAGRDINPAQRPSRARREER